jgi:hypothetical protein
MRWSGFTAGVVVSTAVVIAPYREKSTFDRFAPYAAVA